MDFGVVVVSVVAITATYQLAKKWIQSRERSGADPSLAAEVQALRQEVQQLRQQNNDLLLTVDNTFDRMDRRFSHLESGVALSAEERQQLGTRR